jgi:hypothetical protein
MSALFCPPRIRGRGPNPARLNDARPCYCATPEASQRVAGVSALFADPRIIEVSRKSTLKGCKNAFLGRVGRAVARPAPLRSGRADFPHPALRDMDLLRELRPTSERFAVSGVGTTAPAPRNVSK